MNDQRSPFFVIAGVCFLLLVFGLQIASTVHQESLTWDEGDHIFAGYMMWKTHDYGLNPEHPPLMKLLGTLPLLGLPLQAPADQHRYFETEAYMDGREMLFANGPEYAKMLTFRMRMATMSVAILLGLLVFLAANEMFGVGAAFVALTLLVFEPNVLAHGAFVTTDVGVSCFFFASVYAFYRYCKVPSAGRLAVAGLAVGLALATKHSAVLLLPMLLLLAACEVIFRFSGKERGRRALQLAAGLVGVAVIGVLVLWAFYGFRYNARPGGLRLDPSLAEYVLPLRPIEARGILYLARLHVLPESYLYGLADVRTMANGMPSYFFGKVYEHGIWYYFPAVLLIKSTLGFLGMVLLAVAAVVAGRFRQWREILFLLVPPGVYLLVAMTSHLNIGARHILPLWVFLSVFAAAGAWAWVSARGLNRGWVYVVGILLAMHATASVAAHPNYMAYSNILWGGPSQTHKYLTDSNTDWAQQLVAVKKYTDEHGIKNCWFAYFADPFLLPSDYGIPCKPLPTPDSWFMGVQHPVPTEIEGPVLISAGTLTGFEYGSNVLNPLRGFQQLEPVASIQDGVLVFEGQFAVAEASATSHVQRSTAALKEKRLDVSLAEAQEAVAIAPEGLLARMQLGDALAALGRKEEARAAYTKAADLVKTMEPGAQEEWVPKVEKKLAGL
jgi:hypothetical protein